MDHINKRAEALLRQMTLEEKNRPDESDHAVHRRRV